MDRELYKIVLGRASHICSRSEQCKSDMLARIERWGVTDRDGQNQIIKELVDNGFIDETRYARAYVSEKFRFNHWGRVKLKVMLRAKGIENQVIDLALSEMDPDEYFGILKSELIKKKSSVKASNLFDLKGKLMRFAQGKGFETDLVFRALSEITGN
ncbi:MAG: regulatory protein RecX [Bacteroidales bacterium]